MSQGSAEVCWELLRWDLGNVINRMRTNVGTYLGSIWRWAFYLQGMHLVGNRHNLSPLGLAARDSVTLRTWSPEERPHLYCPHSDGLQPPLSPALFGGELA